jgi:hypothetical protein
MSSGTEPRIGDAERDAAVTALGEHFAAGRLTKEEYDERSDVALRARTDADLRPLFVDLPRATSRQQAESRPHQPHWDRPRRERPRGWAALPLVPLFAALLVLVAVVSEAWWLFFVLGWLFWCGPHRHRHRQRHGR